MSAIESLQLELFTLSLEEMQLRYELKKRRELIAIKRRQMRDEIKAHREQRSQQRVVPDSKQCVRCEEVKDRDRFYLDSRYRDGLYPRCRDCKAKYHQQRKAA